MLVTHDAEEAEELGDVIIGYDDGRVTGDAHRRATRTARETPPGRHRRAPASVIGLVPHSWLNALGIPPWVWNPLSVSLRAAFDATVVVAVVGVALGYLLAKGRFPGRGAIETVFSMPMALPPTVVGWYLLTELGGPGPIRNAEVRLFGHPLTFTFTGIVVAQIVESFPYCLRFSRAAIAGVDPRFEQAARAMGLSPLAGRARRDAAARAPRDRRRGRDGVRPGARRLRRHDDGLRVGADGDDDADRPLQRRLLRLARAGDDARARPARRRLRHPLRRQSPRQRFDPGSSLARAPRIESVLIEPFAPSERPLAPTGSQG